MESSEKKNKGMRKRDIFKKAKKFTLQREKGRGRPTSGNETIAGADTETRVENRERCQKQKPEKGVRKIFSFRNT